MYTLLHEIAASIGRDDYAAVLDRVWPEMPKLSIDYAIMEGASNMAVIPVDIGWSDIGSWATLFDVLDGDADGNVKRGRQDHITIETKDSLIYSDRRVAVIGLEDIIIVDTDDALLVCRRDLSQEVRQVVEQLKAAGEDDLL